MDDVEILYRIAAHEIEHETQIVVGDDYLEDVSLWDDGDDPDVVVVTGWSNTSGDSVRYELAYDHVVAVWTV